MLGHPGGLGLRVPPRPPGRRARVPDRLQRPAQDVRRAAPCARRGRHGVADGVEQVREIARLARPRPRGARGPASGARRTASARPLRRARPPGAGRRVTLARAGLPLTGLHIHLGAYQLGPLAGDRAADPRRDGPVPGAGGALRGAAAHCPRGGRAPRAASSGSTWAAAGPPPPGSAPTWPRQRLRVTWVACAEQVADNERSRFGNPTLVVENWVDVTTIVVGATKQARKLVRKELGIPPGIPVLALIGNCGKAKNHELIPGALSRIPASVHVLHVGERSGITTAECASGRTFPRGTSSTTWAPVTISQRCSQLATFYSCPRGMRDCHLSPSRRCARVSPSSRPMSPRSNGCRRSLLQSYLRLIPVPGIRDRNSSDPRLERRGQTILRNGAVSIQPLPGRNRIHRYLRACLPPSHSPRLYPGGQTKGCFRCPIEIKRP